MSIDWPYWITEVGGGLPAVVIVCLVMALFFSWQVIFLLYRRGNALQDKCLAMAIDRGTENAELLSATNSITSANTSVMREAVEEIRRSRG